MISGYDLQDQAMAKEQAKINFRRNADEERRMRYLNAPKRLIGIDSQALDAQVREMRQNRDDHKEADRMEKIRNNEIQNILESAIQEEKYMRQEQMEDMKRSWMQSKNDKAMKPKENMAIDRALCGISSAQTFGGEDLRKSETNKAKQQEMRRWVKERLSHQDYQKMCDKVENMNYAALLQTVDAIRGNAEMEEADMRKFLNHSVRDENAAMAAEHRHRYGKEVTAPGMPTSLDLFNEDVYAAMDSNGHIIRKDMFKGFTPAQRKRIVQENEMILAAKRDQAEEERIIEMQYSRQQNLIQRALEDANQQERNMREEERMYHLSVLKQQAYEIAMEKINYKRSQQEPPDLSGFYEGFGKSCR